MLYFPMDFGELTIDGLIDTGALSNALSEADLRKIRLLATLSLVKEGLAPTFQIMVANGQLETPKSTVERKFEGRDIEFHEIFIVMDKLTGSIISLTFSKEIIQSWTCDKAYSTSHRYPCNFKRPTINTLTSWNLYLTQTMSQYRPMTVS